MSDRDQVEQHIQELKEQERMEAATTTAQKKTKKGEVEVTLPPSPPPPARREEELPPDIKNSRSSYIEIDVRNKGNTENVKTAPHGDNLGSFNPKTLLKTPFYKGRVPMVYKHDSQAIATDEQFAAALAEMFNIMDVHNPTDGDCMNLLDALAQYMADEGTSEQHDMATRLQVYIHSTGSMTSITHEQLLKSMRCTLRQFGRYMADYIRNWLLATGYTSKLSSKYGLPRMYSYLGFDCADFCKGLSPPEEEVIRKVKLIATARQVDVPVGNKISGTVQRVLESQSSAQGMLGYGGEEQQ